MKMVLLSLPAGFLLLLAACGAQPATVQPGEPSLAVTAAEAEEDPCSPENLPARVEPINDLMREFDELAQQAFNQPAGQLPETISALQRIRRSAEDVRIPPCLAALKTHQLNHMNLTIQTLLAFVGGAGQEALTKGLDMARQEQDLYSLEIIRLLQIPLAPLTATVAPHQTPVSATP